MILNDIPHLVRMLRFNMLSIPNSRYEFHFRIERTSAGAPNIAVQRLALEPFRRLTGSRRVLIGGAVDPGYARSIRECMESQIFWVRGAAWEMYDFGVSRMRVGDEAFETGNWKTARIQYKACSTLLEPSKLYHRFVADFSDNDWHESISQTASIVRSNTLLAEVRQERWDLILASENGAENSRLSTLKYGHLYYAIALAAWHIDEEALDNLRAATRLDPYDDLVASFTRHMEDWIDTEYSTKKYVTERVFPDTLLSQLKLHQLPLLVRNGSQSIGAERRLLRGLGYKGDFMVEITETAPVDQRLIEKLLSKIERQRANYPPGRQLRIEVRENAEFTVKPL